MTLNLCSVKGVTHDQGTNCNNLGRPSDIGLLPERHVLINYMIRYKNTNILE